MRKRLVVVPRSQVVYQLRVSLLGIVPEIWRRIAVPEGYSFWDLHVAIQDSMGWLDYHLHLFSIGNRAKKQGIKIGIPDDDFGADVAAGWEVDIADHFRRPGDSASYDYDFGDGWHHEVLLEGILLGEKAVKYPKCIAGERACPPEDCGGTSGYSGLLEILGDPSHEEHKEMNLWLKGHATNYYPYQPEQFNPASVRFSNPQKRWEKAFADAG